MRPFSPALVLKVLTEGTRVVMEYKSIRNTEHVVKDALEEWKEEPVGKGWVPEGARRGR